MDKKYDFQVVRTLRRQFGLTIRVLAERSGLTYPTVEAIETNKTLPSIRTLDALAGVLKLSASGLLGFAERHLAVMRKARVETPDVQVADEGQDKCRVARYNASKLIRVTARKGDHVHVMGLHEDVREFCYVLSGLVELRISEEVYRLGPDDTIFFDGVMDHSYTQIESGEYLTIHIPKAARTIDRLLEGPLLAGVMAAEC